MSGISLVSLLSSLLIIVCVKSESLPLFRENGFKRTLTDPSTEGDFILNFKLRKRSDILLSDLPTDIQNHVSNDMLSPLNETDFRRAKLLSVEDFQPMNNLSTFLNNPLFFEGDIAEGVLSRNAILNPRMRWPGGRIPYVISTLYDSHPRAVIARAIQEYHEKTCVRFEPKNDSDTNYIYFYPSNGCASQVGLVGGMQIVSIGQDCSYVGIVQHELMHVCGFWHEQSRVDRDDYVRINWNNIKPGMDYNFDKYTLNEVQHLDELYDYSSVMHYGPYAFARGSEPTIVPLTPGVQIGQRYALSKTDIIKINKLYDCHQYLPPNSSYDNLLNFGK